MKVKTKKYSYKDIYEMDGSRALWLAIPSQRMEDDYGRPITSSDYEWYRMPEDVFQYGKEYPTCSECQRKYVPIDNKCFYCEFLRK